jgi:hypothetical protein
MSSSGELTIVNGNADDRVEPYGGRDDRDTLVDKAARTKSAVANLGGVAHPRSDILLSETCLPQEVTSSGCVLIHTGLTMG